MRSEDAEAVEDVGVSMWGRMSVRWGVSVRMMRRQSRMWVWSMWRRVSVRWRVCVRMTRRQSRNVGVVHVGEDQCEVEGVCEDDAEAFEDVGVVHVGEGECEAGGECEDDVEAV